MIKESYASPQTDNIVEQSSHNENIESYTLKIEKLESTITKVEHERDKVVLELNELVLKNNKLMNDAIESQKTIAHLTESMAVMREDSIFVNQKELTPEQQRSLRTFIKNHFFKQFKYVFESVLKHKRVGLECCFAAMHVTDACQKQALRKCTVRTLQVETAQRRFECSKKVQEKLSSKSFCFYTLALFTNFSPHVASSPEL